MVHCKCLKLIEAEGKKGREALAAFANFHGVNIPIITAFLKAPLM